MQSKYLSQTKLQALSPLETAVSVDNNDNIVPWSQAPVHDRPEQESPSTATDLKLKNCHQKKLPTVFESKDKPTQMTKQSFTIVDFITYSKSIHFELICKDVHN